LYNWANVIVFLVISAAMITVSAAAVRHLLGVPAQVGWYPTDLRFVLVWLVVSALIMAVVKYGFEGLAKFSTICAPWLFVIFVSGSFALFPVLSQAVTGQTQIGSFGEFLTIAQSEI
jgi:NCS1 family nucleobase:cation symporter-1